MLKINYKYAQMEKAPTYFHGTILPRANTIFDDDSFLISEPHRGALGYGAYAFWNDFKGAKNFAEYKFKCIKKRAKGHTNNIFKDKENKPCILSFKLNNNYKVLQWNKAIEYKYIQFIREPNIEDSIARIKQTTPYNNDTANKSLDGRIMDLFLSTLNLEPKNNGKYKAILMSRHNIQLPPSKHLVPKSTVPNSIELCVKTNKFIDFSSIKIYNIHGKLIRCK